MVTPEMLLWLAERMGLESPRISKVPLTDEVGVLVGTNMMGFGVFRPHTDDAQFGRLVVWAIEMGHRIVFYENFVLVGVKHKDLPLTEHKFDVDYDSTPDSIRAAAVVAICRALNYQEPANV